MPRDVQEPTRTPHTGPGRDGTEVEEEHPAFGRVVMSRHTSTPPATLFDSEIQHTHYVTLTVYGATRTRALHRDWIHPKMGRSKIEIAMSEAQWASMVSSFSDGGGTSCTIQATETDGLIPGLPFSSRLAISTAEARNAADKIKRRLEAAVTALEEKATKVNVRALRHIIDSIGPNVEFAAQSLTEHAENVVQKARADVEAMVDERAKAVGLPVEHRPSIGLGSVAALPAPVENDEPDER